MAIVKVGDVVRRKIEYGMEGGTTLPAEEGTVVYVHPEGRFYSVEFRFEKGRFRQAYPLPPPEDRVLRESRVQPIIKGHHNKQGALGKWLANL